MNSTRGCSAAVGLALILLAGFAATAAADVYVSLQPIESYVAPDSVFQVFVFIDSLGAEFNGYETVITWDEQVLEYVSCQPESLFSQYGNQWWVPEVGTGQILISHAILQGGAFETGPGALSSITFRADQPGDCPVAFQYIDFYRAGFLVEPVFSTDALVHVIDPASGTGANDGGNGMGLWVLPNPSRNEAWIRAELPGGTAGTVWLLDAAGRNLGSLRLEEGSPAEWRLDDMISSGPMPAGVYFLRMQAGGRKQTERVVRIR